MKKASSSTVKRPKRTEARREAILAAAEAVFLDNGFAAANLDSVARRANASKATIYAHFGNKLGLFRAIMAAKLPQAFAPLISANRSSLSAAEVLRQTGTGFLTLMLSPAGLKLYRLIIAGSGEFPDLAQTWFENGPRKAIGHLAGFLQERTESGELAVDHPRTAAEFFLMMLRGTLQLRAVTGLDQPPFDRAIAEKVDAAVAMFLKAYGVEKSPSSTQRRTAS